MSRAAPTPTESVDHTQTTVWMTEEPQHSQLLIKAKGRVGAVAHRAPKSHFFVCVNHYSICLLSNMRELNGPRGCCDWPWLLKEIRKLLCEQFHEGTTFFFLRLPAKSSMQPANTMTLMPRCSVCLFSSLAAQRQEQREVNLHSSNVQSKEKAEVQTLRFLLILTLSLATKRLLLYFDL